MKKLRFFKNIPWRKAETPSEIPLKAYWDDLTRRGWRVIDQSHTKLAYAELESRLRTELQLYPRRYQPLLQRAEIAVVSTHKHLATIFLHHGDGWVREAALQHLNGPLSHPAEVYACVLRLNDWVPNVQMAAQYVIARCFPKTSADVISPALLALLPRVTQWGRLQPDALACLDDLLERHDVFEGLVSDLLRTSNAGASLIFREVSRNPAFDAYLERLACHAQLPHIRALAFQAILTHRIKFPERRREKRWIDRRYNTFVWQDVYAQRDVTGVFDTPRMLETGAMDGTAIVRRVIADHLLAERNDIRQRAVLDRIADHLSDDKRASVRSRIAFYDRMKDQYL